jgi:hypothetical protein
LLTASELLCWSAKWVGGSEHFGAKWTGKKKMVRDIHKLMSEADAICHYNGCRFDIPTLNREFLLMGLKPPAPAKQIDLFKVVKQNFRFASNKLAHVVVELGVGKKVAHSGHELWVQCMAGDKRAQVLMGKYCRNDTRMLEPLLEKLRPWIRGINFGLYQDESLVCPKCGSDTYQRRGESKTATCVYQRFQCCKCGGWFRSVRNIGPKPSKKFASI